MKKMVAVFMLLFANAAVAQVQVCNLVSLAKQAQFKALGIPVPTAMTEFMTAIELINAQTTALNCEFPPARAIQDLDNAIAWRVTKFARAQGPTYTTMLVEYAASGGKETLSAVVAIKWLKHNNLIEKFNTWDATDVRHNYEALAKQAREKAGADAQQAKAEPPRDQPSQQAITPRIAGAKPQAVTQPEASHPQDAEMSKKANADGLRLLKTSNPDFQAAKRKFEEAVRSDSSNVEALNNLGYVYQRLGDFRTSEAYILKTIQLDPDRRVAYGNLGYVQAKLAKSSEASHNFCEYIKRFNDLERGKATLKRVMSDPDVNVQSAVNEAIARCSLTVPAQGASHDASESRIYRTATGISWFGIETGQSKATVERLLLKDGIELATCVSGKTPGGAPKTYCIATLKHIDLMAMKAMVIVPNYLPYPKLLFIHDELVSYKYTFGQSDFEAMALRLTKGFGAPGETKKGWAAWSIRGGTVNQFAFHGGCLVVFLIKHASLEPWQDKALRGEEGEAEFVEDESRKTDLSEVIVNDNCRMGELADKAN
jgi:tetratricopeptide (TPR) repeat protein